MKKTFLASFLSLFALVACDKTNPEPQAEAYELEYPKDFGEPDIPSDNPLTTAGVELGRHLFYEKALSADRQLSCGSCHQQQRAFTDNRRVGLGIRRQEGEFNTMALANSAWEKHFFWDGRAQSLEEQALEPIENPIEMGLSLEEAVERIQNSRDYPERFEEAFGSNVVTAENIGKALAQFQRTLVSSNSKYDKYLRGEAQFTEQEQLGFELFFTHPEPGIELRGANCGDCHSLILQKGSNEGFNGFHNNGLDTDAEMSAGLETVTGDSDDRGKFKTPSLRNIALTAPYMHDGRFQTLEEVMDHYNEHVQMSETLSPLIQVASNEDDLPDGVVELRLTDEEKQAVIAFLHTLSDTEFVEDERFADPFE